MIFYTVGILFFTGFWTLLFSRNIIRLLIGLEILVKALTLTLISVAYSTQSAALGQTLFITVLVIEVVVAVIVLAFIVNVYEHTESLDVRSLTKLHG